MKVLQINTTVNRGSVGRHTENVGKLLRKDSDISYVGFGRGEGNSESHLIRIGGRTSQAIHLLSTRLFDNHGLASKKATAEFVKKLNEINPDLVHLRNVHGYYLNYAILFNYLREKDIPVVWTFHDCWPFTGHCSHFELVGCSRWQTQCYDCPNKKGYPASYLFDRSAANYRKKKELFTSLKTMQIITPSNWLTNHVRNSFFSEIPARTIYNGIDTALFRPVDYSELSKRHNPEGKKVIIGSANVWTRQKGWNDFIELSKNLKPDTIILLIGLNSRQMKSLPPNIIGIRHTNSIRELAEYYSMADVFINPTYSDNFPTANLEALACGTPVITYNTGGSPEAVDDKTGIVINQGDVNGLLEAAGKILSGNRDSYTGLCRDRAVKLYNKDERYAEYLSLYRELSVNR